MNDWRPPPEQPLKYEKRGARAVERGDGGLALHRGFVDRAIAEIDQLLGMPDGEARIGAGVAGVGRRHGVAARRPSPSAAY